MTGPWEPHDGRQDGRDDDGGSGRVPGREMVRAVLDGELVTDDVEHRPPRRHPTRALVRAVAVRVLPRRVRTRALAVQAARDALGWVLRSPWRAVSAVARGGVHAIRGWRRWVRVHDYRDAAEHAEKLADRYMEIRALTIFRWRVTGAVVGSSGLALTIGDVVWGAVVWWTAGGVGAVALAWLGRRKDGSPGRSAVLAGPRSLTWTMDPGVLVEAFRDAKLIGKDESLRLVERAHRQGDGWAVTVDLPATRKAADVIAHRDALAVDEVQLIAERVRGRGGHAGRVGMWVADDDPYDTDPIPTPRARVEWWDAWQPVPFGRDARDRPILLPLVWTSLLVGAIPRQGKTFATRLAVAGLVLDPTTRLLVFDGKGGKDWKAAELVAHRFVCGDNPEHVAAVRDALLGLVAEVQARFARMAEMDDELCPESKITPAITRNPAFGMPITAVVIDEVQVFLEDPTREEVGGRKTTTGVYIAELLTYLAKKGPAAGIVVVLATQRPDSKTIPSSLRSVLGTRFALRVMDWRDSNIILGEQMNTRGHDASTLLPAHKGVGILRPDGESDAGSGDTLAVTVRTHYMPNTDWRAICEHGRDLRARLDTLTGHAIGDTPPLVHPDPRTVGRVLDNEETRHDDDPPNPSLWSRMARPTQNRRGSDCPNRSPPWLPTSTRTSTTTGSYPRPNLSRPSTSNQPCSDARCQHSDRHPARAASRATTAPHARYAATTPPTSAMLPGGTAAPEWTSHTRCHDPSHLPATRHSRCDESEQRKRWL